MTWRFLLLAFGAVTAVAAAASSDEQVLFKLESPAAVQNGPTQPTVFSLERPTTITKIWTYHWNDGQGAAPGAIALKNVQTGEILGTWPAVAFHAAFDSSPGAAWSVRSDGPPFRYWTVQPNITVLPGIYEVIDSDRNTWSTNGEMRNRGVAWVYGVNAVLPPRAFAPVATHDHGRGEVIDPAQLVADIASFRGRAAIDPAEAWRSVATGTALRQLPGLQRAFFGFIPPEVGWSYFFHGAIYVLCPHHNTGAVALFYHPWSDTGLVTLWQRIDGRSRLIRVAVVPGDVVRNPSAKPIDLPPAWLRQADRQPPLITVSLAAGTTLRSFIALFPEAGARAARYPLPAAGRDAFEAALDDAERMKTFAAVASVRLLKCFEALQRYEEDPSIARYRTAAEALQAGLARGDFGALAGPGAETLPETLSLLLKVRDQLSGYSVVAFAGASQSCQVFLSHPAEPRNVLGLWLEDRGGRIVVRRVDFISHDLAVLLGEKLQTLVDTATAKDSAVPTRNR